MKYFVLLVVTVAGLTMTGCGGPDRVALARQTVQSYWHNIGGGHLPQAYALLDKANRDKRTQGQFAQDTFSFLTNVGGLVATVGKPSVQNDFATVPVVLKSTKGSDTLHAYQHLYWENNAWRISDDGGTLSKTP